jgi:hypothetical protein
MDMRSTNIQLDCSKPGRVFDGIGGNFRLQNPAADPAAIQYNLDNLPVVWGRVAMPLDCWEPGLELAAPVRGAMGMAGELARRGIRVIASTWVAPAWALGPETKGLHGRPVLPEKMDALCETIASYLICMRDRFGCEAEFFSFNESNLGIDIRQTPQEHAEMIKRMGAEFQRRGLSTRQLLGDTSNAVAINFIQPAMADAEAMKYVGAVSFHSWNGGGDEIFAAWGEVADRLQLPLFCAEAGTDPAAYKNPPIFEDAAFSLAEINLYVRMCGLCEPTSLMQWQMTSDYPLVVGSPPRPLRRFWQWRQLGLTPTGARSVRIQCTEPEISCCAFTKGNQVVVHLVNAGTDCPCILAGLDLFEQVSVFVTNKAYQMKELERVIVISGKAQFGIESQSFCTVIGIIATEPPHTARLLP